MTFYVINRTSSRNLSVIDWWYELWSAGFSWLIFQTTEWICLIECYMHVCQRPLTESIFHQYSPLSQFLGGFTCCFLVFQGITFDEFRSFFQFLNNLEDFAIAMQMYNFASRSIGQGRKCCRLQSPRVSAYTYRWWVPGVQQVAELIRIVFALSSTRWVCKSSVCGHWAEADTSPRTHHLQDLWRGSRRPALLQGVHWNNEGPAAQGSQGEERNNKCCSGEKGISDYLLSLKW